MLYAQVVFNLAIEGPFDYLVPDGLHEKIQVGSRVKVSLRTQKVTGYVVGLSKKTGAKYTKEILGLLDDYPVLDKNMLSLTRKLSAYYACSWGEAIDIVLPQGLRRGKKVQGLQKISNAGVNKTTDAEIILVHDLSCSSLLKIYLEEIQKTLRDKKGIVVIIPDIEKAPLLNQNIKASVDCDTAILFRGQKNEVDEWQKIKNGQTSIVIGTRSAVFAPMPNLGLIIIDEEESSVYKQDQVPHYHVREVAISRCGIEGARLILGSCTPSLETFYQAHTGKIKYRVIPRINAFPQVKILDTSDISFMLRKKRGIFLPYMLDSIRQRLDAAQKSLLFINRKGFATLASCRRCGMILKCQRCNINLVYHFSENILSCHYCNFKMPPPDICPNCNSDYIRYTGSGTEKIESELHRIFPAAKITRLESHLKAVCPNADIVIATQSIMKSTGLKFNLIVVLSIDNMLNRLDFRAAEKAYRLLFNLSTLTDDTIIIPTNLIKHHLFVALSKQDHNIFYNEELKQRRSLGFPPVKHICLVKLRGKNKDKVKNAAHSLFDMLSKKKKPRGAELVSVNPFIPPRLRGNFYWQILFKTSDVVGLVSFLKINLKEFSHSGIIVTVDVDPI